jgi:hypothetical protein
MSEEQKTTQRLVIDFDYQFLPILQQWKRRMKSEGISFKDRVQKLITNDFNGGSNIEVEQ